MQLKTILICALVVVFNICFSQGVSINPLTDCGLTYGYDAAGNRVIRLMVRCGHASGKTEDTTVTAAQQPDNGAKDTLISEIKVSLFPNPTSGKFTLQFNQPIDYLQVMVVNGSGQVVLDRKTAGQQIPVDISSLAAGVYYVKLYTTKEQFSKIVVKK